jgi:hypothetical protein
MTSQQGLDFGASPGTDWVELGHDLAPSDDRKVLSSVLHCIEDVREVPGRVGSTHIRHRIRLSDEAAHNIQGYATRPREAATWQKPSSGTAGWTQCLVGRPVTTIRARVGGPIHPGRRGQPNPSLPNRSGRMCNRSRPSYLPRVLSARSVRSSRPVYCWKDS